MPDEYPIEIPEAFKLDSGLREDMIFSIHAAYFAPHADYMEGQQLMLWLIGTDENDEPQEIRMSIGSDWTTADGNIVTHPTRKHITKTSIYGFWLHDSFFIVPLARLLFDRADSLGGDSGGRDSRIWLDLILHLQTRELSWGKNSSVPPQERLMPTEFLGLTTDTPTAKPAPMPTPPQPDPAAVVAAAKAQAAKSTAQTNGSPLFVRAIELAKTSSDFATFLGAALADPEILADDELAVQCADQNQIWAAAHP